MQILRFDTLDSTSTQAASLLKRGETNVPFAVIANAQTAGRGRQGAGWESPRGNLYVTIVMPPVGDARLWSGRAGQICADILQKEWGITVTQKWPNDLFFQGKKLGGILCESQSHGDAFGPVLIGIGININHSPTVEAYGTIALAQILGKILPCESWSEVFVEMFATRWRSEAALPDFTISAGHMFLDAEHGWLASLPVADSGEFRGTPLLQPQTTLMSASAGRSLRWLFQNAVSPHPVLVADIGNTRCKIGAWQWDALGQVTLVPGAVWSASWKETNWEMLRSGIVDLKNREKIPDGWPIFFGSVGPQHHATWEAFCHSVACVPKPLRKRPVFATTDYNLEQIGIDRLAAIEACLGDAETTRHPTVLVSSGTALTVDFLDATHHHLGGWIVPGVDLALASLHERTGQLPRVDVAENVAMSLRPGLSTAAAISRGILSSHVALVRQGWHWLAAATEVDVKVQNIIVTGGQGKALAEALGGRYDEHLILRGLFRLAQAGS